MSTSEWVALSDEEGCPNVAQHTPAPTGYFAKEEWFRKISKTHRQRRCPRCSLWVIWESKKGK